MVSLLICAYVNIYVSYSLCAVIFYEFISSSLSLRSFLFLVVLPSARSFLPVHQSLPLVVRLLSRTGWGAPRGHVASGPAVTLFFTLLVSRVDSWGQLAGVGAGGGRRSSCAPTTALCGLVDLLCSVLAGLWVLRAWEQLFFSVFAHVHTAAGRGPLTQLLQATMVLDVVALVLKKLDDCVFGQVELCRQSVNGLLVWVQANILDEALQDTQGLQGNLECTQQGFRKDGVMNAYHISWFPKYNSLYLSAWSWLLVAPSTAHSARCTSTCSSSTHTLWALLIHWDRHWVFAHRRQSMLLHRGRGWPVECLMRKTEELINGAQWPLIKAATYL